MSILGDICFTKALNTAKDESIQKHLEEGRNIFIHFYRDHRRNEFVPSMEMDGQQKTLLQSPSQYYSPDCGNRCRRQPLSIDLIAAIP